MSRKLIVAVDFMPLVVAALVILLLIVVGCDGPKSPCPGPCKVRVLAFTAKWCEPCKRAVPALLQIRAGGADVRLIDIDDRPQLAKQYDVTSVPTYIVYACGGSIRTQDITMVQRLTKRR